MRKLIKRFDEFEKVNELSTEEYKKAYEAGLSRKDSKGKNISKKALEGFIKNLSEKYKGQVIKFNNGGEKYWYNDRYGGKNPIATSEIVEIWDRIGPNGIGITCKVTNLEPSNPHGNLEFYIYLYPTKPKRSYLHATINNVDSTYGYGTSDNMRWEVDPRSAKLLANISNEFASFVGSDDAGKITKNDFPQF